jgi:hypothetical protein
VRPQSSKGGDPLGPPPRARDNTKGDDPLEPPQNPRGTVARVPGQEDVKIINLARSALARTSARQGACVRDTEGRSYAGASVALEHLSLSAIQVAVAMAVSSGAPGVEAVALAGEDKPSEDDLALLRELPGTDVVVWNVDVRGAVRSAIEVSHAAP